MVYTRKFRLRFRLASGNNPMIPADSVDTGSLIKRIHRRIGQF